MFFQTFIAITDGIASAGSKSQLCFGIPTKLSSQLRMPQSPS